MVVAVVAVVEVVGVVMVMEVVVEFLFPWTRRFFPW